MTTTIQGISLDIPDGAITNATIASDAGIGTSKLETRSSQSFPIPLTAGKVWDSGAHLPTTASGDDLAIKAGSWGSEAPTIQTADQKNNTSLTSTYGLWEFNVPQNYKDGGSFVIRVRGGMITTVASTAATVDLTVYKADDDGGVSADLCQTSASTINSLTKANVDFNVLASSLDPGDRLFARLDIAINDTGTGTDVIGEVSNMEIICQTQG